MDPGALPDLSPHIERFQDHLDVLRQNKLLTESAFLTFAKKRGIPVAGVVKGDPGEFCRYGWLSVDGGDAGDRPLFHPFRIYTLHHILRNLGSRMNISPSSFIRPKATVMKLVDMAYREPDTDKIGRIASADNRAVDLAILLEPLYWPRIVGRMIRSGFTEAPAFQVRMEEYHREVTALIGSLDPTVWRTVHETMRRDAAIVDENTELYLQLRLAHWDRRERLKGSVSAALWMRHIAELLRRGFEEIHGEQWPEEDEAFGQWAPGGRRIRYGAERPLDDEAAARPLLAWHFGLFTGSQIRWYVEGSTEYGAILQLLPQPSRLGVELVNLAGQIAHDAANAALKVAGMLEQDREHRRFSMISFDSDVEANVRFIRRQVEQGKIVGLIAAHDPDFEFGNFTITELVEVAARMDERNGFSGDPVRNADWSGVRNANAFDRMYCRMSSRRPRSLKGPKWGRALADHANENPRRDDDGRVRPLLEEIRSALRARVAHYEYQREHFTFDRQTFKTVPVEPEQSRPEDRPSGNDPSPTG
jgi:hypothetical protein